MTNPQLPWLGFLSNGVLPQGFSVEEANEDRLLYVNNISKPVGKMSREGYSIVLFGRYPQTERLWESFLRQGMIAAFKAGMTVHPSFLPAFSSADKNEWYRMAVRP